MTASLDVLDALGLEGGTIRVNDRRALDAMLDVFGFARTSGRACSSRSTSSTRSVLRAWSLICASAARPPPRSTRSPAYLDRPQAADTAFDDAGIRAPCPPASRTTSSNTWSDSARRSPPRVVPTPPCGSTLPRPRDGVLHTGTIFELAHPSVDYIARGRGPVRRHDRPLPRTGRARRGLLHRFRAHRRSAPGCRGLRVSFARARARPRCAADDAAATESRSRVRRDAGRLEQRSKNLKALLERSRADGYTSFATVSADTTAESLEIKPLD